MHLDSLAHDHARHFGGRLGVGIDIVQISRIGDSLQHFGDRFLARIFTADEAAYATACGEASAPERLAARFAAKEAAMKALCLGDAGVGWRDIEVLQMDNGACRLALHGRAAQLVAARGVDDIALSLSHDGDYATAVVTALRDP